MSFSSRATSELVGRPSRYEKLRCIFHFIHLETLAEFLSHLFWQYVELLLKIDLLYYTFFWLLDLKYSTLHHIPLYVNYYLNLLA